MKNELVLASLLVIALAACAPYSTSGQKYERYETKTAYTVEYGEVVSTRDVKIEGEYGVIGTWGGASVGSAVGSGVGDGSGRRVARAVGGVAGAVAGQAIEKELTSETGLEIIIALEDGGHVAIVQANDVRFADGERVQILFGPGGSARVRPL